MPYFTQDFLDFFGELSNNNNRKWFEENKKRYEESVKKPFESFVEELIHRIQLDDESINITTKEAIFRIYRDIRFSKDKTPYKTHASAVIAPGGRKELTMPGTYIQLGAEDFRFYGGAYMLDKKQLQNLREFIASNLGEFKKLLNEREFKKRFGTLHGEQNKRIPKEFTEAAEVQPLLFNKQFYFYTIFDPKKILSKNLMDTIMKLYHAGKPLTEFLKIGMQG